MTATNKDLTQIELYDRKYQPDVLNVLRVIATLCVFLLHGNSYIPDIYESRSPLTFILAFPAWAGVWIFLFLSGYLFGFGAERGRYPFSDSLKIKDVLKFYLHRFLRIAPIYYTYIAFFEFFTDNNFIFDNPITFLKILTFTFNGEGGISGVGHLWYISLSMQMYLFMPFIYFILNKIKNKYLICGSFAFFALAGLGMRLLRYPLPWYSGVYTHWLCNLDFIICGILAAIIAKRYFGKYKPSVAFKLTASLLLAALIIGNCWLYYNDTLPQMMFIYRYLLPTAYIICCSFMLFAFNLKENKVKKAGVLNRIRAATNFCTNYFANNSFAFYVFHISTFILLERTLQTLDWYINSSFYIRYFLFFGMAFAISLIMGAIFNRIATPKKRINK